MGMAKTCDGVAAEMVSTAPVVTMVAIVRTQLDHSKGNQGTWKGMTIFICTDERIYIPSQFFPGMVCTIDKKEQ
jgi:hypothetical protein